MLLFLLIRLGEVLDRLRLRVPFQQGFTRGAARRAAELRARGYPVEFYPPEGED